MATQFSKRHYIAIARVIHNSRTKGVAAVIRELADLFEQDNDSFDRDRFLHACKTGEMIGENIRGGPAMQYGYSGRKFDNKLGR